MGSAEEYERTEQRPKSCRGARGERILGPAFRAGARAAKLRLGSSPIPTPRGPSPQSHIYRVLPTLSPVKCLPNSALWYKTHPRSKGQPPPRDLLLAPPRITIKHD